MNAYKTVDQYMDNFSGETRDWLESIRKMVRKIVPEVGEKISYGVPTFTINGKYFIYIAGFKNHISIYPVTTAMEDNIKELPDYRTGKGTLQFPIKNPLPLELIERIIKVRYQEMIDTK